MKNNAGQVIVMIIGFLLINALLWGGQELYYYKDTQKTKQIKAFLETDKAKIIDLENSLAQEEAEIKEIQEKANYYKNNEMREEYNSLVDDYNLKVKEYNENLAKYKSMLEEHNKKIKEVNVLIERSGKRWYLIPIPLPIKGIK